jgi:hypothetical protein
MKTYKLLLFAFLSIIVCHSNCFSQSSDSIIWDLESTNNIGAFFTSPHTSMPHIIIDRKFRMVVHFNGIDQGLLIKGNPLGDAKTFIIEIIFKPDSSNNPNNYEQRFFHLQDTTNNNCRILFELRLLKSQRWALDVFSSSDSSRLTLLDTTITHPVGKWYHAAMVFENGTVTSYVNGVKELSGKVRFFPIKNAQISLGVRQNLKSFFKGAIAKVKFTKRALLPNEFITK